MKYILSIIMFLAFTLNSVADDFVNNFKVNQRISLHNVDDHYEVNIFKGIDPAINDIVHPYIVTYVGRDYIVAESINEEVIIPIIRIKAIIRKTIPGK